ncbi:MAG TPA: ATP-binding protein [Pyrinomonadaceae bacterium]|nr:ATP-binding protein [Pyrinomonadaceae bacterium]
MSGNGQLKIVGGGSSVGDEKLRLRFEAFIKTHPHLTTLVLSRADYIGMSRTTLDAYLNGTYFVPKESGGLGVNPKNTQIEAKIRAYLDKAEGVVKDGYTSTFLETRSWMQFQHACKTAIEEKVIVVVYAKPGVGKSRCLQEYKTERMTTMPIDILCSANVTTRYFVQKIARAVGVDDRAPTAQLEDLIAEKMKKGIPRPIFVDQANYLNEKALGTICYLWELTKIPIILIGTTDLYELFTTSRLTEDVRAQLSSRVAMHYPLMELSIQEVKTICKSALGPNSTDEAVAKIFNITNGNHRHINMLLPRLNASAKSNAEALEKGELAMEKLVEKAASKIMV